MKPMYEVWCLGFDEANNASATEKLCGEFYNKEEAVQFAKDIADLSDVFDAEELAKYSGDCAEIRVEKVNEYGDYSENIETVYLAIIERPPCPKDRIKNIDAYTEGFIKSICFKTAEGD